MKHPQHWRLQFNLWQKIRRRYLDRCAWCHGPSRKQDSVNISHQWDADKQPWWGNRDCFHQECSSIHSAHLACICEDGIYDQELGGWAYGNCAKCGKRREWRSSDRQGSPTDAARRILASIPKGQRDAAKSAQVSAMWAKYREQEAASA